jgi:hypothetical protein
LIRSFPTSNATFGIDLSTPSNPEVNQPGGN